jgi:hypothetical protein
MKTSIHEHRLTVAEVAFGLALATGMLLMSAGAALRLHGEYEVAMQTARAALARETVAHQAFRARS